MVRIQRERKRVSHANRPWVSTGVASMLPARSLTTKVLPSRMLTVFSAIAITHRSLNAQTKRQVAGDADRTADRRRDEVLLAGDDADERVAVAGQDAVGSDETPADDQVAAVDRHPAAVAAHEGELARPARLAEVGDGPPVGELGGEGVDALAGGGGQGRPGWQAGRSPH